MSRLVASMWVVLAAAGVARGEAPSSVAAPFLTGDEDNTHVVTGGFGPAKDTTVVVTFSLMGVGTFSGFTLVPDGKAKHGQRKLALPKLPSGSMDGAIKTALIANLDKDAEDELVLELGVTKAVQSPDGGHTYSGFQYVVLDWDGKKHVRAAGLEKKLAAKMDSREVDQRAAALTEADLRAALGVAARSTSAPPR